MANEVVNRLKSTSFKVIAAFTIVILAMIGTGLGYDSFLKDVGFLAAGYLFGQRDALQSKSGT
jgi:hypothetical protein